MEFTGLPPKAKVREKIEYLIRRGITNDRELAKMAGTTPSNAAKVKSILKHQKQEITTRRQGSNTMSLQRDMEHESSLEPFDRKNLWAKFEENKSPLEIILEKGYAPEIVEKEYRFFRKFRGCDLFALQFQTIGYVRELRAYMEQRDQIKFDEIVDEFEGRGDLANREYLDLVKLYGRINFQLGNGIRR